MVWKADVPAKWPQPWSTAEEVSSMGTLAGTLQFSCISNSEGAGNKSELSPDSQLPGVVN